MTTSEARKILESLADGRCPQTGQKLPTDSVYQQPDVVRALFVAARALGRVERIERSAESLHDHSGRAWDTAEEQQLCEEFAAGKSVAEIAQIHQRTRGAIRSRLERLGKIAPQEAASPIHGMHYGRADAPLRGPPPPPGPRDANGRYVPYRR